MREILFKAKRVDNGEWVEGWLFKTQEHSYIAYDIQFDDDLFLSTQNIFIEIDTDTICQYTGLTDKNGNKIWENDIVKYHFGNDAVPIKFGKYQSCFDSSKTGHIGFYVDWDCEKALRKDLGYWVNLIDCNIIGNVFDDTELEKRSRYDD